MSGSRSRSNTRMGDLIEQAAERSLLLDGWLVHRTRRVKFHQNDLFSVFDLMAVAPHDGSVLFVQTTDGSNVAHRKRKVEAWARPHFHAARWAEHGPMIQVWAYGEWPTDGTGVTGFRVFTYLGGRTWERHDAVRPCVVAPA
jgi:hypothetical protein